MAEAYKKYRDPPTQYKHAVKEHKSIIYRAWNPQNHYEKFEKLQAELLGGRKDVEDRIAAFWKAYITVASEVGPVDGLDVPEKYQGEITFKPEEEEESLDELVNKSDSTNIVGDFFWAYSSVPNNVSPADAPSAGAWFFLDMKKNNKNKFADLSIRILDKLAAQEDEQKSREADYTKAMGLLEAAAEKHLSGKKLGEVRRTVRRGAERIRKQSEVSTKAD